MNNETLEWLKLPTWEFEDRGCMRLRNFIDECFDDKPIYEVLLFNQRKKPKNVGPSTINVLEDIFAAHGINLYDYWIKGKESDIARIRSEKNKQKLMLRLK